MTPSPRQFVIAVNLPDGARRYLPAAAAEHLALVAGTALKFSSVDEALNFLDGRVFPRGLVPPGSSIGVEAYREPGGSGVAG
jgi:hypothetical protein